MWAEKGKEFLFGGGSFPDSLVNFCLPWLFLWETNLI